MREARGGDVNMVTALNQLWYYSDKCVGAWEDI